jgi:DNA-binding response OmpR family regulator
VDDEAHIRRVVELKLRNAGYEVLVASDGQEGLELLRARRPDAVICDIMMPRLDGKSLCHLTDPLKAERRFLTVIVTCRISPDERKWVDSMTDTVLMEKPFSPSRLLECVERYFASRDA